LRGIVHRGVVARQRSLDLLIISQQERGLLMLLTAFFPVVPHVSASFEVRRSNRTGVLGWEFSGLQESEAACGFMGHIVYVAGLRTGPFPDVFIGVHEAESCQGDVSGTALRTRACGLITSKTHLLAAGSCMSITCRDVVASHAFPDALASRVQKNRSLLTAIWRRGSQAASLRGKAPFLHIGLDEDESHLSKVDMNLARSLSADRGEEVLRFETVCDIVQFLAVTGEEDGTSARPVPDSYNITLDICGTVSGRCEGLVVASVAV
jgi:hypothetical protein